MARHTEPEGGRVWTILGHKDVPLSAHGKRHWREVAAQFGNVPLDAVYCSDLQRSWWCAELVAREKGLTAVRFESLRELNCGTLDGMTREQALAKHPDAFEGLKNDPVNYRIPEGETLQEVSGRVLPALEKIRSGAAECVLLVAHAVVNRAIVCDAMGLHLEYAYRVEQSYGGLTIIDYGENHPVLHTINSSSIPTKFTKTEI